MLVKCLKSLINQQSLQLRIFNNIKNNHNNLFRSSLIENNRFSFFRQLKTSISKMPAKKTNTKRKVLIKFKLKLSIKIYMFVYKKIIG